MSADIRTAGTPGAIAEHAIAEAPAGPPAPTQAALIADLRILPTYLLERHVAATHAGFLSLRPKR